jgi:nitroreductase
MSSFYEAVESRRSVRAFLPEAVPQEVLDRALDAALLAPSSSNLQPWRFIVLRSPEARAKGIQACLDQAPATSAPLLVALVARPWSWRRHRDELLRVLASRGPVRKSQEAYYRKLIPLFYTHGPLNLLGWWKPAVSRLVSLIRPFPRLLTRTGVRLTAHKTTALAAATFMLALRAEGYDSCPMEGFDPHRAAKALGLARNEEVNMFFAIGKRAEGGIWNDRVLMPRAWTVSEI